MLQVYDLTKSFRGRKALDGVTLQLQAGETLVVMGPSGCGKSTLLRCIPRLIPADRGEIWFDGTAVMDLEGAELREYRRRIGFVFQQQERQLIDHMTVLENVILGPVMAGTPRREAVRLAQQALARVGLLGMKDALPRSMSGGEQQRAAIARAIAMRPRLILWDEPTAALDPILVEEVLAIMAELAADGKTAMIVVTHEIPFALEVADRVALMEAGRIVLEGKPKEVLFETTHPLSRRFRRLYELRYAGKYWETGADEGRNSTAKPRREQGPVGSKSWEPPPAPPKGTIQPP